VANEVKTVKVKLNGQELEVQPGYRMRTLHAESDAGLYPRPVDITKPTQGEITAHALWSERLVASYFELPAEFMLDCDPSEVMQAAAEIQKAKMLDPFGNPLPEEPEKPTAEKPEPPPTPAPTIGS
jgi:hypothetical protein